MRRALNENLHETEFYEMHYEFHSKKDIRSRSEIHSSV